ncbi:hypothetical protein V6N13_133709 [Hibiscus sabdariffa]
MSATPGNPLQYVVMNFLDIGEIDQGKIRCSRKSFSTSYMVVDMKLFFYIILSNVAGRGIKFLGIILVAFLKGASYAYCLWPPIYPLAVGWCSIASTVALPIYLGFAPNPRNFLNY